MAKETAPHDQISKLDPSNLFKAQFIDMNPIDIYIYMLWCIPIAPPALSQMLFANSISCIMIGS